jgi:[ribosomal protein S18]-alanine N-acetyltransferase
LTPLTEGRNNSFIFAAAIDMNITITPFQQAHCNMLASLEVACFGTDAWPAEAFTELFEIYSESPDFRGQVWVALDDHEQAIIGYIALEVNSLGEAELTNLAVSPAYRRHGVGSWLVSFVRSICQEIGVNLLWLRVRASNIQAVHFYEVCGFAVRGEFRSYYDDPVEDALILAIDLPDEDDNNENL